METTNNNAFATRDPSLLIQDTDTPVLADDTYHVVYNPASFDSVYAAATLIQNDPRAKGCITHSFLEQLVVPQKVTKLVVVGVELSKETLNMLFTTQTHVTLFAYRDGYKWFTARMYNKWGQRLNIIWPTDEHFDPLTTLCDNTAIWMAYNWLQTGTGNDVTITFVQGVLSRLQIAAMRFVAQAHPVVCDLTPVGTDDSKEAIVYKARLFNLYPQLKAALRANQVVYALSTLVDNPDQVPYIEHWHDVGRMYKRACHAIPYKGSGGLIVTMPTMACNEDMHYHILNVACVHADNLITYEDLLGLRVWRVHIPDRSLRARVMAMIDGPETWMEGASLCTYTKVKELIQ